MATASGDLGATVPVVEIEHPLQRPNTQLQHGSPDGQLGHLEAAPWGLDQLARRQLAEPRYLGLELRLDLFVFVEPPYL